MLFLSTRAGAEGRARGERARAQTKVRAERRGDVAEKVTAGRAAAVVADGIRGVSAQPVAASFTQRIDALHGEAGQILHFLSLSGRYTPDRLRRDDTAASEIDQVPLRHICSPRILQNKSVA